LPRLAKIYLVILFGTTLFLQSFAVQSAELLDVQVELRKERYRLYSEVQFDASREALYELLIDYEKFEKFTSAIVESSNVEPDEKGRPGFYARMEGCVLLFCKSFIRRDRRSRGKRFQVQPRALAVDPGGRGNADDLRF
jgi:hypothetical protein